MPLIEGVLADEGRKAEVLPVVQGDWVASALGQEFRVAKVVQSYLDSEGYVLVDLALYDSQGVKIGRESPPMGGPTGYEPACSFTNWRRIAKPEFPIEREEIKTPLFNEDGSPRLDEQGRQWHHYDYSYHPGVKAKSERVKPRKQSRDYASPRTRVLVIPAEPANLQEDIEATSLRRSAQELREQGRRIGGDTAVALNRRAAELEAEAAKIKAPFE